MKLIEYRTLAIIVMICTVISACFRLLYWQTLTIQTEAFLFFAGISLLAAGAFGYKCLTEERK